MHVLNIDEWGKEREVVGDKDGIVDFLLFEIIEKLSIVESKKLFKSLF